MREGHHQNSPWRNAEFRAVEKKLEVSDDMMICTSDENHVQNNLCEKYSQSTEGGDKEYFNILADNFQQ